jgi:hypothetical protein
VTVESRSREAQLQDLARGLELLAARLREMKLDDGDTITDTIYYDESEINYSLIPHFPSA